MIIVFAAEFDGSSRAFHRPPLSIQRVAVVLEIAQMLSSGE